MSYNTHLTGILHVSEAEYNASPDDYKKTDCLYIIENSTDFKLLLGTKPIKGSEAAFNTINDFTLFKNMTSVQVPDSVTSLGNYAFSSPQYSSGDHSIQSSPMSDHLKPLPPLGGLRKS